MNLFVVRHLCRFFSSYCVAYEVRPAYWVSRHCERSAVIHCQATCAFHRQAQPGGFWQFLFLDMHESPQGCWIGPQCLQQAIVGLLKFGVRVGKGALVRVTAGAWVFVLLRVGLGILLGVGVSVIVGVVDGMFVFFRF
jgi:hypothetical protein